MMSTPFDIGHLREAYRTRRITPVEVAAEALRRISAHPDPAVWIMRVPEDAVVARASALAGNNPETLPLFGIPFFYWYQFLWVLLTSLLIYAVHVLTDDVDEGWRPDEEGERP